MKILVFILSAALLTFLFMGFRDHDISTEDLCTPQKEIASASYSMNSPSFFEKKKSGYMVRSNHQKGISPDKLDNANHLSDLIEHYPFNWIKHYSSVTITSSLQGRTHTATGSAPELTSKQKKILKESSIDSEITITVLYQEKNDITQLFEDQKMEISYTVIPHEDAYFSKGNAKLMEYFENGNKFFHLSNSSPESLNILFTIDESGAVSKSTLITPSGNEDFNNKTLELINNMSGWVPAKTKEGIAVPQTLELVYGATGC